MTKWTQQAIVGINSYTSNNKGNSLNQTLQELGYTVEGLQASVISDVEQGHPVVFIQALRELLSDEKVVNVTWIQNFKTLNTSRGRRRKMKVTFDSYLTGIILDKKHWENDYFSSFVNDNDGAGEPFYLTELEGLKLDSIPEDLGYFSRVLNSGEHADLLFNSFGDNIRVKVTKTQFAMRFEVESLDNPVF